MIEHLARTYTKSGVIISTVFINLPDDIAQPGGNGETALVPVEAGEIEILERYETRSKALRGHKNHVDRHGGTSFWNFLLF